MGEVIECEAEIGIHKAKCKIDRLELACAARIRHAEYEAEEAESLIEPLEHKAMLVEHFESNIEHLEKLECACIAKLHKDADCLVEDLQRQLAWTVGWASSENTAKEKAEHR